MATNPAVTLKDNQQFVVGPFSAVDAKGAVIGPATGISGASGDESILTVVDNSDGTFTVHGGTPGQAQATFTDTSGKTLVIDNTVIAGDEAGISATIGAPTDQPVTP